MKAVDGAVLVVRRGLDSDRAKFAKELGWHPLGR